MQRSSSNGTKFSTNSYISLGLALLLIGAAIGYGVLSAQVDSQAAVLSTLKTDYVTSAEYNATLKSIEGSLAEIKIDLRELKQQKER